MFCPHVPTPPQSLTLLSVHEFGNASGLGLNFTWTASSDVCESIADYGWAVLEEEVIVAEGRLKSSAFVIVNGTFHLQSILEVAILVRSNALYSLAMVTISTAGFGAPVIIIGSCFLHSLTVHTPAPDTFIIAFVFFSPHATDCCADQRVV